MKTCARSAGEASRFGVIADIVAATCQGATLDRRALDDLAAEAGVRLDTIPGGDGADLDDRVTMARFDDGTTVVVTVSPPDRTPWPMRGMSRLGERDLLSVDGVRVSVEHAVNAIDFVFDDVRLLRHLVDSALLTAACATFDEPTADELAAGLDAWRRGKGLCRADDLQAWLDERTLTVDGLEQHVAAQLAITALRRRLTDAGTTMEDWLDERRRLADVDWAWGDRARTDKATS